jgi:hypothetical protein
MRSSTLRLRRYRALMLAALLAMSVYAATTSLAFADPPEMLSPPTITNWIGNPLLKWKCTELHKEASIQLIELATGLAIENIPWRKIQRTGETCNAGIYLMKHIDPPINIPCIPASQHHVRTCPPAYSALVSGKYEAILNLRGGGAPSVTHALPFQITDNINTNFSVGHDHWTSVRGSWAINGGQYVANGLGSGKIAVAHYDGNVIIDRPPGVGNPSTLSGTRDYEAVITLHCSNASCAGGLAVSLLAVSGSTENPDYAWLEFVVSGDRKLSVTSVFENPPKRIPHVSGIDLSKLIIGGKPFRLKVTYVVNPWLSQVAVEGHIVWCKHLVPQGGAIPGEAGLVFSSPNTSDSMSVDKVVVGTSRNGNYYQWCDFPIPVN